MASKRSDKPESAGGQNGGANGAKKSEPKGTRNARGLLLPGHPPLPGQGRRPGSRLDFMAAARRVAKQQNMDIEELLSFLIRAMIKRAAEGDNDCMKMLLARMCGPAGQDLDVPKSTAEEIVRQLTEGGGACGAGENGETKRGNGKEAKA